MSSIYCEFINDNIEASSYVLFSVDSHPDILKVGLVVDLFISLKSLHPSNLKFPTQTKHPLQKC